MNAYLAGVDLVSAVLDLACQRHPPTQPVGGYGTRSRQLLLAILGAAERGGSRVAVARELVRAVGRRGDYANAAVILLANASRASR
jgi:hypothetical protein